MSQDNEEFSFDDSSDNSRTGVQFEEEGEIGSRYLDDTPAFVVWTMRYSGGLVKSENQAKYTLLGFVVVAILIATYLLFSGGGGPNIPLPPGARIIYPPGEPPRVEVPVPPSN